MSEQSGRSQRYAARLQEIRGNYEARMRRLDVPVLAEGRDKMIMELIDATYVASSAVAKATYLRATLKSMGVDVDAIMDLGE